MRFVLSRFMSSGRLPFNQKNKSLLIRQISFDACKAPFTWRTLVLHVYIFRWNRNKQKHKLDFYVT